MNKIMFSIIIPVYNVERYLNECIDSVLNQTYKNYEVILVNDGSTDSSKDICEDYKNKYKNVIVIHKENGGLSSARNAGINVARGEYLLFLDSDDYWDDAYFLDSINDLINKNNGIDLCVFGMKKLYEKSNRIESINRKNIYSNGNECIEKMIKYNYFKASACDKIIKRKIVLDNKIEFPIGMLSEDIKWTFDVLCNCNEFFYFNKNVYVYRQRAGSISKTVKDKNIVDMLDMINYGIKKSENIDKEKKKYCLSYLAYEYSVALGLVSCKNNLISDHIRVDVYSNKSILSNCISNKVKIVLLAVKLFGINRASKIMGKFIDSKGE